MLYLVQVFLLLLIISPVHLLFVKIPTDVQKKENKSFERKLPELKRLFYIITHGQSEGHVANVTITTLLSYILKSVGHSLSGNISILAVEKVNALTEEV